MARNRTPKQARDKTAARTVRLHTLEVSLSRETPAAGAAAVAARTLQLRGDQSLEDLHRGIATAFERQAEPSYEFQFDVGPLHPEGKRYVVPAEYDVSVEAGTPAAGRVTDTTLDSLALQVGQPFGYWPDAGDDWWYSITVRQVKDGVPRGRYPRILERNGDSPFAAGPLSSSEELGTDTGADTACLVGEVHLSKGAFARAIEAFSRAIAARPTADAYEGRARAYRALAGRDEQEAERLRHGRGR